jgi:hypothetical protein
MVLSFALYPAYGLIAFLPISRWAKTATMAAGWGLSWSLFFGGSLLAGKEGVELVKAQLARRRALLRARFSRRTVPPPIGAPPHPSPLPKGEREPPEPPSR